MRVTKITENRYLVSNNDTVYEVNHPITEAEEVKNDLKDEEDKNTNTAEPTSHNDYFFKNIIFFTNDRDEKSNKTLKNLNDAIKGKDINLVVFVAEEVEYKATDKYIKINDSKTKYKIDTQSNVDTIVIVRLGAQDSDECVSCIEELQSWGLFVLNPIHAAERASNKYESAVLMERYKIPQPKFTLVSKMDIKDGNESLSKKLKNIYKDYDPDDKKGKFEFVVKILDGHGGTGVFMTNNKGILAILQAMFAVDEELELLVQKKEEADGGDIRVHVLTSRTQQKILASMKRVKISGDFRSNVSLGATAEKVELTEEQEDIAKRVAKISGMPWCAVDIMPLVKGSNPEIGDNVVLEFNSSPGTDGISEVIEENFCTVLLDAINDINELVLTPKAIGYKEDIDIILNDEDDPITYETKLDTGNGAKASTIGVDKLTVDDDTVIATINDKEYKFKRYGISKAKVGPVTEERNTVIIPRIKLGTRQLLNVEFALVDNRNKSTKVLLNRDVLSKLGYVINPAKKHILKDEI